MPNTEIRFDSWGESISRAEMAETGPLGRDSRMICKNGTNPYGIDMGTDTFEAAVKLARDGWTDGADRLAELTARLTGRLSNVSSVKRIGFDVMGPGVLDAGRYAIGHPENMMVWQTTEELTGANPDRVLRLVVCCSTFASTSADTMYWRGAAGIAIADLAESSGVRVEIEMVRANEDNRDVINARWTMLKRAQDHIDPAILAFALCHPSAHRRIDWGIRETLPVTLRNRYGYHSGSSYGHPCEIPESMRKGECIYVPMNPSIFRDANSTATWVIDALREHEIEVETA